MALATFSGSTQGTRPNTQALEGVRAVAPLALGVFVFGLSFGMLARQAGMGIGPPLVMSLTTFAGSAQFAAASVLEVGGGIIPAALAAVILNLRYLAIGISIAPALSGARWRRVLEAQLAVDEAWAVAHMGGGRYDRHRLIGAGLLVLAAWVSGTGLGLTGGAVVDPRQLGLDAMFPALFLSLLVQHVRDRISLVASILASLIAVALIPLTPPGIPIVAAGTVGILGLRRTS